MKKLNLFTIILLFGSQFAFAQKDYKVVFDLTSGDTLSQQTAIRWVNEIIKAEPTAQVEVVMRRDDKWFWNIILLLTTNNLRCKTGVTKKEIVDKFSQHR